MANKYKDNKPSYLINDSIRHSGDVRLIGDHNGIVVDMAEARSMADEEGLDLVAINMSATPPIMKICDYSKFLYEQKKMAKKARQAPKPLKEIQLRVNIAQHDLETKAKAAERFLADGSKVKVVLTMKGRELSRRAENKKTILLFLTMLEGVGSVESMPKDEGNRTTAIVKPKKH